MISFDLSLFPTESLDNLNSREDFIDVRARLGHDVRNLSSQLFRLSVVNHSYEPVDGDDDKHQHSKLPAHEH